MLEELYARSTADPLVALAVILAVIEACLVATLLIGMVLPYLSRFAKSRAQRVGVAECVPREPTVTYATPTWLDEDAGV